MPLTYWELIQDRDKMPALRLARVAPNTKTYWVEDAACETLPPELFEPEFPDTGSHDATLAMNEAKMEQARKACSDCPVWHLCYTKASPDDFFYTMRAGVEPAQLTLYRERGRVEYRSGQASQEVQRCKQGHNNWKIWGKKKPRRKCVDCSRANSATRQAKRATLES